MSISLATNFTAAHKWSISMRDRFLAKHFYQKYSLDGRYVFIDKSLCSTLLQKRLAIDTIVQAKNGSSLCIEEKIEQWPGYERVNLALETESCTVPGKESPGWMRYARADYLLYAFASEGDKSLDVYFINFLDLRKWFWQVYEEYPIHVMQNTSNHTRFRKVPIKAVEQAVPATRYHINDDGCISKPLWSNAVNKKFKRMQHA